MGFGTAPVPGRAGELGREAAFVLTLALLSGFVLLVVVNVATFLGVRSLAQRWSRVAFFLAAVGSIVGVWLGFAFVQQPAENFRTQGWPFPVLVFQLEGEHWVDYVGLPIVGLLNAFIVETVFLIPVSILVAWSWLQRRLSQARPAA